MTAIHLPATRAAALARLEAFVPNAGRPYAELRNSDIPGHPHVSGLSPYLRHRIVTESEVIAAVRAAHPSGADKFLSEVYWRTYWKGWLQLRPEIWDDYRSGLRAALNRVATGAGLRAQRDAACAGATGIAGFDDWARELAATGYLHNHARMWFASIWIFTLRLPWELGADFFLRHLLDGDPASNTLSWRWVAGLHTPGKTYIATADNIARHSGGRFHPQGLATHAEPMPQRPLPAPRAAPAGDLLNPQLPSALLLTEEDLSPGDLAGAGLRRCAFATLAAPEGRSPLTIAPMVAEFTTRALAEAAQLVGRSDAAFTSQTAPEIIRDWARRSGAQQVVSAFAPVGPVADRLDALGRTLAEAGIPLIRVLRPYDRQLWPHATHGFFRFRAAAMG